MKPLALLLVPVLLFQEKCDLRKLVSPDAIQPQVVEAIQPYFPNAKAYVLPDQHMIVAVSCAQGLGPEMLNKIFDGLVQDPTIPQKMSQLRLAPLIGGARYDYFGLAFENAFIIYDVNLRQFSLRPMPEAGFNKFRADCGFDEE